MSEIITYDWGFGDGGSSVLPSPTNTYTTGWYTVELSILTTLGYYSTVTKEFYIKVGKSNLTNFNADFLENKTSFHYGWNNETGFGWSFNSGDDWIWAESKGAVMRYSYLGDGLKLAWDMYDDKQYIINTGTGSIADEYTDKAVDGLDGTGIIASILFPEFNGEKESFTLNHIQTDLFIRALIDGEDLNENFEVDVKLYDANCCDPVDIKYDTTLDGETVFYYQTRNTESNNYRRIEIDANRADFKFLGYESAFKVIDRARNASKNLFSEEEFMANCSNWYTRGYGYNLDRVTGTVLIDMTSNSIAGPDGDSDSAIQTTSTITIDNEAKANGAVVMWKNKDQSSTIFGLAFSEYGTVGDWTLVYYNGVITANLSEPTDRQLFDLRIFDSNIDTATLKHYYENLLAHLPRN